MGCFYHSARKTIEAGKEVVEEIQQFMKEDRDRKVRANRLTNMSPSEHMQFQCDVEITFRRLVSAIGGVAINGFLFAEMPIYGIAFCFNLNAVIKQAKRLKGLVQHAGGYRQLANCISMRNMVIQAATGGAIKAITTFIFLGEELNNFMSSIDHVSEHFLSHPIHADDVVATYDHIISHEPLKFTTDAASAPVDAMKKLFGHMDHWDWQDDNSLSSVLSVGAAIAVVDKGAVIVADGPWHAAATKVAAGRKRRC